MSAIAGIHARNDSPVRRDVLERLGMGLRHRASGELRFAHVDRASMVYWSSCRTSGLGETSLPQITVDGGMISMDGHLDNRDEILRALRQSPSSTASDGEVFLAAYHVWGTAAFGRLIGDFAAALWDPKELRLVLVCDGLGARPLYYHLSNETVSWASLCRPLRDALSLPLELDEEYIADFIVNRPPAGSPFKRIGLIPGGHALVVDGTSAELRRYWSFDPGKLLQYQSDEEYESHFRMLFEEAVACRLRTPGPVFCELSGGLDSSSIAAVANRLMTEGRVQAPEIRTVSYVFDHAASSDERKYIRPVEDHLGGRRTHITEADGPLLRPLPGEFLPDLPTTQLCFHARQNRVTEEMIQAGASVLLNGIGGDQLFLSEPPDALPLADSLSQGRVLEVWANGRHWARLLKWPLLKTLWVGAVLPLLPPRWDSFSRWVQSSDCWNGGFAKRTDLRRRSLALADDLGFALPSASMQYRMIRHTMRPYVLKWFASAGCVDVRYPYLDRRLVEFALAIPLDQKVRGLETRSIVRRSLRGALPEAVLRRRTKQGPTEAFHRAVIREWPWLSTLLDSPRVTEYGFVELDALTSALTMARHGLSTVTTQLLLMLSLELWLRSLDQRAEGTAPYAAGSDRIVLMGGTAPPGRRHSGTFQGGVDGRA